MADRPPLTEPSASLEEVRRILLERLRGIPVKIFLFGSRARGDARRTSDIDIALLPREPLPSGLLGELKEALEASSIPYQVDLLDLGVAEATIRERILKEGILWNDCASA